MCAKSTDHWFDSVMCFECEGMQDDVCPACGGSGTSAFGNRPDDYGPWAKCSSCNGSGSVPCEECDGSGTRDPVCPNCDAPAVRLRLDEEEVRVCDKCYVELEDDDE
jgi:DnaJ-class molecular chaperone